VRLRIFQLPNLVFSTPFIVLNPNKEPISEWAQGGLNPWPTGYEPVALPG
jgi:hypothetical protein